MLDEIWPHKPGWNLVIRPGREDDLTQLLSLCVALKEESNVTRGISIDLKKMEQIFRMAFDHSDGRVCLYVYESNGAIHGATLGAESEYYFSRERYASDLFLYVDRTYRRGLMSGIIAKRLWVQYRDWAIRRGLREIRNGVSTGIGIEASHRFFLSLGMEHIGGFYRLPLKQD